MKRILACTLLLTGCFEDTQEAQQEKLTQESNAQVGMPAITRFQEKRMLKMILELRDQEVSTFTYYVDMNGKKHLLCNSIGFGFPYATQYTNPMKQAIQGVTIPQADPNGLYSPASADGTWVICLDKITKKVSPVYVEPLIIVSPFALEN
jgi:hypothetical protein